MNITNSVFIKDGQLVQLDDIISMANTFPVQYGALTFAKDRYGKVTCTIDLDYIGETVHMPWPILVHEVHIISNRVAKAKTLQALSLPFDVSLDEINNGAINMHTDKNIKLMQHTALRFNFDNKTHKAPSSVLMNYITAKATNGIHNGYPLMIYNPTTDDYTINIHIYGQRYIQAKEVTFAIPVRGKLTQENITTQLSYSYYVTPTAHNVLKSTAISRPCWYFDGTSSQMIIVPDGTQVNIPAYSWYAYLPTDHHYTTTYNENVGIAYDQNAEDDIHIVATIDIATAKELVIDPDFIINGLVWKRNMKHQMSTICFPCDLLASEIKNATVYSISKIVLVNDRYKIKPEHLVPVEKIVANTPYIIIADEDNTQLDIQVSEFRKIGTLEPNTVKIPIEDDDTKEFEFRVNYKSQHMQDIPDWDYGKFYGVTRDAQDTYDAGELAKVTGIAYIPAGLGYMKLIDKE